MENKTDYVIISLSLHLTFARLMKEHAFFLENSFMPKDKAFADEAEYHKRKFEKLLANAIKLSDGMLSKRILESGCILSKYTLQAEKKTEFLTGIPINQSMTIAESTFTSCSQPKITPGIIFQVKQLNQYAIRILNGMIHFKERILKQILSCQMAVGIYPTFITHTIYEAKIYRKYIMCAETKYYFEYGTAIQTQMNWNKIMTEHALFTARLLDPTETYLIQKNMMISNNFMQSAQKLKRAKVHLTEQLQDILSQTIQLKELNESTLEGILNCRTKSITLPLLTDHMLREVLFYLYLLQQPLKHI